MEKMKISEDSKQALVEMANGNIFVANVLNKELGIEFVIENGVVVDVR